LRERHQHLSVPHRTITFPYALTVPISQMRNFCSDRNPQAVSGTRVLGTGLGKECALVTAQQENSRLKRKRGHEWREAYGQAILLVLKPPHCAKRAQAKTNQQQFPHGFFPEAPSTKSPLPWKVPFPDAGPNAQTDWLISG